MIEKPAEFFWWKQGENPFPREVLNYSLSHFYLLEAGLKLLVL